MHQKYILIEKSALLKNLCLPNIPFFDYLEKF